MKILFVITGLGTGGAERQVVDLANRLVELNHIVTICFFTGRASSYEISRKVEVIGLNIKKNLLGIIYLYYHVNKIIRSLKPDIVHSHMIHANIMTRLVRLSCTIPRLICTAHSSYEGGRLRMLAYRLTDFLADLSTNVSVEAVSAFEAAGAVKRGRMVPVYNGVDIERFRSSERVRKELRRTHRVCDDEKVILAVGRLSVAKDYPNLLHAFAKLSREFNDIKLWIVGDGELRERLEELAISLNVNSNVRFWGVQSNVADWMNAADIFVLSSAWEGFGLVVAEAMACQKLVVASDSGGVKEVLGDYGFMIPPHDSNALAAALKKAIILGLHESNELGLRARERIVENYSLDNAVLRWLRIYKDSA